MVRVPGLGGLQPRYHKSSSCHIVVSFPATAPHIITFHNTFRVGLPPCLRAILEVLELTNWRVSGASGVAELLGMKPTTLEARMRKLGIRRAERLEHRQTAQNRFARETVPADRDRQQRNSERWEQGSSA